MEVGKVLREKKLWMATVLVVWAAGLQWHMSWIQKQDAFKQKFQQFPDQSQSDNGHA